MNQILIISLIFLILIGACGEKSQNKSYEVITPSDRIFTFEDLESVGFKKSKEYNVDGLEGAKGALYGFWATDKGQKEYELRFYPSHAIAVSSGEPLAQEVTGKNGKIKKSEVTWKEGVTERRQITDSGNTEDSNWNKVISKHGNYSIYGNIVMLCEGPEIISMEVCWKLISALEELE